MEKRGVIEDGRTPPEEPVPGVKSAQAPLESHVRRRAEDAAVNMVMDPHAFQEKQRERFKFFADQNMYMADFVDDSVVGLALELKGLDPDEVAQRVASLLGGSAPSALVEQVVARGRGNPFFTSELVSAHLSGEAIPIVLSDLISTEIADLDDPVDAVPCFLLPEAAVPLHCHFRHLWGLEFSDQNSGPGHPAGCSAHRLTDPRGLRQ